METFSVLLIFGFMYLICRHMFSVNKQERDRANKPIPSHNCTSCKHYAELRIGDTLMPDKTVRRAYVQTMYCWKGSFHLDDTDPCEMYEGLTDGDKRSAKVPPPRPPRNREIDY